MTYCPVCCCHIEPSTDPRIGWEHHCRHEHKHAIAFAISEKQRAAA